MARLVSKMRRPGHWKGPRHHVSPYQVDYRSCLCIAVNIRTLGAPGGAVGRGGRIIDALGGCVVGIPKTDMAAGSCGRGAARGALGGAFLPGRRPPAT